MKTKLLKKVRKRYVITYYSKQLDIFDTTYFGVFMTIKDKNESFSYTGVEICTPDKFQNIFGNQVTTKEEARLFLLKKLASWIRKDYRHVRTRVPRQTIETIWYKK